ncbi:MAG: glucosidase [Nitrospinaceae bacterium]|nr:MAG: glucosidase [Nitrospinaceae bacterium]
MTPEHRRLKENDTNKVNWKQWGPYLAERQWGTVREDYSQNGDSWEYFSYNDARSRAYRWGEDGIAGISDDQQRLCLSLALWNGKDPTLKERFFGLTNAEGNHGEDVKEYYYYLDATPTHSYLKMLYKYPQSKFPYERLIEENRHRDKKQLEFELIDTRIFDADRYFDILVEYAKASPNDILMRITIHNRNPEEALVHVLPQIWFRNTWSWSAKENKPHISVGEKENLVIESPDLGTYHCFFKGSPDLIFCDNETNLRRLNGQKEAKGYFKDAFTDYLVNGDPTAINPQMLGTKAAAVYKMAVPGTGSETVLLRLTRHKNPAPFLDFEKILQQRRGEADLFYAHLQNEISNPDARNVQRQAFAGLIWTKQFYHYDVPLWLKGDSSGPPPPESRRHGRNSDWKHLNNADIISMPDKWEYPWYAAWDLAFHCIPMALIDPDFAKSQLVLLTREWYMHPNGQLPAYEWNFGDVNPPVHAWATWRVFQIDRKRHASPGDFPFLEKVFHKLLINFTWWVNRKDAQGLNIFQGGFLGLDNIGVFDRSKPLPTGGYLNQADGTSWMAMYCLNMMRIALELALRNPVYEDIATKFFEHFLSIAEAMNNIGDKGFQLWDEEDQFFYDVLNFSDNNTMPLKVRSLVGLIPLFAVETLEPGLLEKVPNFKRRLNWFLNYRPDLCRLISHWNEPGLGERRLLSLLRGHRMKSLIKRALDETEFLSTYGVRSLSKFHKDHPYIFKCGEHHMSVSYISGESDSHMFGGNSNWRGPIWFPANYLLIESLQKFHHYYGNDFKIEYPTDSNKFITINDAAKELSHRLTQLFLCDKNGRRAVYHGQEKMQTDLHFKDHILFYEYFDGDTGRGLGASHQTGWTALIAKLLQPRKEKQT